MLNQSEQTTWFFNQSGARPIVTCARFPVLGAGYMDLLRVLIGSYGCLRLLWLARSDYFGFMRVIRKQPKPVYSKKLVWTVQENPLHDCCYGKLSREVVLTSSLKVQTKRIPERRLKHWSWGFLAKWTTNTLSELSTRVLTQSFKYCTMYMSFEV